MEEILEGFQSESRELISQLLGVLEDIEGKSAQFQRLEEFGQVVDRIMGAAKTLAELDVCTKEMEKIGAFSELCKVISYKCSQVGNNESLFNIVVAFLMDASDTLLEIIDSLSTKAKNIDMNSFISDTFLDRLKWLSTQFDANLRATVGTTKTVAQSQIDDILKQMGVGSLVK